MNWDWLLGLDRALFTFLNGAFHVRWFDQLMLALTDVEIARPLLAVTAILLVALGRRRGFVVLLGIAITITLSDQLGAHVIKPWVGRERPCSALSDVVLLVKCTGSPSFPSVHATNSFALALFFSRFAARLAIPLFVLAFLVSYSRIHIGVHYPFDMVGGAAIGMGCATLVLALMNRLGVGPRRSKSGSPSVRARNRGEPPPSTSAAGGATPDRAL